MWSFSNITDWIDATLRGWMGGGWALTVEFVLIGVAILAAYAVLALILIYVERKVCGFFQCRIGPNRVGKWGVFQSVADMIKILLKELVHIDRSDKVLFRMASFFVIIGSICTFAAIPFAKGLHAIDFNVSIIHENNIEIAKTIVPLYLCPSETSREVRTVESPYLAGMDWATYERAPNHYAGISDILKDGEYMGSQKCGVFSTKAKARITHASIKDGASNTLMVVEATPHLQSYENGQWIAAVNVVEKMVKTGADKYINYLPGCGHIKKDGTGEYKTSLLGGDVCPICDQQLYSYDMRGPHPGIAMGLKADASVAGYSETIARDVIEALCTRNGRESVMVP